MIMRLHHREHKCKHYTWVWYFSFKVQYKPFFPPTSFSVGFCFCFLFSFIKARTIKYVHREVRNIWKHLKKVNTRLRISWVCWRHHCYSTGNVSSHLSAYQCSIPFCITQHQELEDIYGSWGHSGPHTGCSFLQENSGTRQYSSNWSPDSSWTLGEFFFFFTLQSLMVPFIPENQTKVIRKNNTLMIPINRNCRAMN